MDKIPKEEYIQMYYNYLKSPQWKSKRKEADKIKNKILESKGKIVRRLNKLGIKEYEGKKVIQYSIEELQEILLKVS